MSDTINKEKIIEGIKAQIDIFTDFRDSWSPENLAYRRGSLEAYNWVFQSIEYGEFDD